MNKLLFPSILLVLAGCASVSTTRTLGTLQEEYRSVLETENACQNDGSYPQVCMGDFKAQYALIEYRAAEAIKARADMTEPGEKQITIALYRLAAFASLSADSGNAATYSDKGAALCKKVSVNPPRDCALLTVLGQYEVVEAFKRDVDCIISTDGDSECPDELPSEEAMIAGFCAKQYLPLVSKTNAAKQYPHLSPTVLKYLDDQLKNTRRNARALINHIWGDLPFSAKPENPCACARQFGSEGGADLDCGEIRENAKAIWMAYCVNDALEAESPSCPTF